MLTKKQRIIDKLTGIPRRQYAKRFLMLAKIREEHNYYVHGSKKERAIEDNFYWNELHNDVIWANNQRKDEKIRVCVLGMLFLWAGVEAGCIP